MNWKKHLVNIGLLYLPLRIKSVLLIIDLLFAFLLPLGNMLLCKFTHITTRKKDVPSTFKYCRNWGGGENLSYLNKDAECSCQNQIRDEGVFRVVSSNDTNNNRPPRRVLFLGGQHSACESCCILFANWDFTFKFISRDSSMWLLKIHITGP